MRFHNHLRRRKIKRYRKIHSCEYAILFDNSNDLIEYICNHKNANISNSSLYTKNGNYQLIIFSNHTLSLIKTKNTVFKDKLHIDEIKTKSRLICKDNAISKIQKAFKAP